MKIHITAFVYNENDFLHILPNSNRLSLGLSNNLLSSSLNSSKLKSFETISIAGRWPEEDVDLSFLKKSNKIEFRFISLRCTPSFMEQLSKLTHITKLSFKLVSNMDVVFSQIDVLMCLVNLRSLGMWIETHVESTLRFSFFQYLKKSNLKSVSFCNLFPENITELLETIGKIKSLERLLLKDYNFNDEDVNLIQKVGTKLSTLRLCHNTSPFLKNIELSSSIRNLHIYDVSDDNLILQKPFTDTLDALGFFYQPNLLPLLYKNVSFLALGFKTPLTQEITQTLVENQTITKLELWFQTAKVLVKSFNFIKCLIKSTQTLKLLVITATVRWNNLFAGLDFTDEILTNNSLRSLSVPFIFFDLKKVLQFNKKLIRLHSFDFRRVFSSEFVPFLNLNYNLLDFSSVNEENKQNVFDVLTRNIKLRKFRKQKLSDLCKKVLTSPD